MAVSDILNRGSTDVGSLETAITERQRLQQIDQEDARWRVQKQADEDRQFLEVRWGLDPRGCDCGHVKL